jgi:hypothetical protein
MSHFLADLGRLAGPCAAFHAEYRKFVEENSELTGPGLPINLHYRDPIAFSGMRAVLFDEKRITEFDLLIKAKFAPSHFSSPCLCCFVRCW